MNPKREEHVPVKRSSKSHMDFYVTPPPPSIQSLMLRHFQDISLKRSAVFNPLVFPSEGFHSEGAGDDSFL